MYIGPMAFSHSLEVRFRDLDALGHVNNAVVVTYLEMARWAWWQRLLGGREFQEAGFLIARVEVDYRVPIRLGDPVQVDLRCVRVGGSSFDLAYEVRRGDGTVCAEARTVQVMLDFPSGRPVPVDDEVRAWLAEWP